MLLFILKNIDNSLYLSSIHALTKTIGKIMFTDAYLYRLEVEYIQIQSLVYKATGKKLLPANLRVMDLGRKWGEWRSSERLISLNIILFKRFEWDAVIHVFKHEVAHQMVNEIFQFHDINCPHGEHFSIACEILGISDNRTASSDFLFNYKHYESENPIVGKIRKLYIKGNDEASTAEEQLLFLKKANFLMDKHNIPLRDVNGRDDFYLRRQLTEGMKRFNHFYSDIGSIITKFYHVRTIKTYYRKFNGVTYDTYTYLEAFGEPTNLDVAEYVFNSLLNQGNILYEKFKKNRVKTGYGKISKAAYFFGLIKGYEEKMLAIQDVKSNDFSEEERGLIHLNDKMLKDLYESVYNVRYTKRRSRGDGYLNGKLDGKNLSVSLGVKSSTRGNLLC